MELICSKVTHSDPCDDRQDRDDRGERGDPGRDCHCEVVCGHYG